MSAFLQLPVVTSSTQLEDEAIDRLVSAMETKFGEGWDPADASLLTIAIGAIAPMAANAGLNTSIVMPAVFRRFGTKLLKLPYNEGSAATATTTWTIASSEVERTIPAGTQIAVGGFAFYVNVDTSVPASSDSVTVSVVAAQRGEEFNGLAGVVEQINPLDWVLEVQIEGESSGGTDQEDDEEYELRLTAEFELLARPPIRAVDFAKKARNVPSTILPTGIKVGRATAVEGWNPETKTSDNLRTVCVFVTDRQGNALSNEAMEALEAWLRSLREANFLAYVRAPSYTPIFVKYQVHPLPGVDGASLVAAVNTALLNYLSSALWGDPTFGAQSNALGPWYNEEQGFNIVRYNKILGLIESVLGVDYVPSGSEGLAIGVAANPTGTADIELTGPAPLPTSNLTTPTIVGAIA